jgi:hypothetical protein
MGATATSGAATEAAQTIWSNAGHRASHACDSRHFWCGSVCWLGVRQQQDHYCRNIVSSDYLVDAIQWFDIQREYN